MTALATRTPVRWRPNVVFEGTDNVARSTDNRFPVWITVVAIVILIPVLVWALSTVMHIAAAMSIGGILAVAGIVLLFIWLRRRVA